MQPENRAAYLDEVCGDDAALRQRVEQFLNAQAELGSFLESPAAAQRVTVDLPPAVECPGTMVGPFKLLQQIGEGGMGTVWMAQQSEPIKRLVAIKLIKPGMDSKQVLARFDAERQALALMDHPNIAKVFDAGTTGERGCVSAQCDDDSRLVQDSRGAYATPLPRPYFVMELVKGVPITKYCDENHLTPRQRLELFVPVCQAIQHAHQKGIIHRDIKPSNVLVAMYDDRPVPKVIDFGVAKATGQQLTEATLHTNFGAVVGTIEYMSPEQASFNQLDVDTRSDIYSLGVLLYELLAGSPPFTKKELEKAGMLEMLRLIREQEPSKPSTKLSTSAALPSLSANRGTEPSRLTKLVRGELDWIVMKALEKDRNRRYESANGFAMDVQRYLADEAVQACPPSAGYRLRKFAKRNKAGVITAAVVLFFLVLSGSIAGWAWRDRAARTREAELERVARTAEQASNLENAVERAEFLQREGKRGEALAALERAQLLAREAKPAPPLAERIESLQQRLDAEGRDEAFVAQFEAIRREVQTEVDVEKSTFRSGDAFARIRGALEQYGIAMGVTPPDAAATHIGNRPPAFQTVAVAALDEALRWVPSNEVRSREWLIDVLQKADSDPWRNKVRPVWKQPAMLEPLARDIDVRQQPPSFLLLVVTALPIASPIRLDLAQRVQFAYPGDFWANHELGRVLNGCARKHVEAVRYYTAALALRPDNPGVLLNRANALSDAKELDAAVADLQRAVAVSPRYATAYLVLGNNLPDLEARIACFKKAIEINPNYADAYNNLGIALASRSREKRSEAIAAFKKAIEIDPVNSAAYHNLPSPLGFERMYLDPIFLFGKPSPHPLRIGLDLAFRSVIEQKRSEHVAWFRNLIERNPSVPETYIQFGLILESKRFVKQDEVIAVLRRGLERLPGEIKLAHALAEQGWKAITYYDPKFRDPKFRDPKLAIAAAREAVAHAPQSDLAWQYLGWIQYRAGDWRASIEALEKSCKLQSGGTGYFGQWIVLALAHAKLAAQDGLPEKEREQHRAEARRRFEQADKQIDARWQTSPGDPIGRAIWNFRSEARDEAIAAAREVVRLKPNDHMAHYNLGVALRSQDKLDEAAAAFRTAVELEPKNVAALNSWAWCLNSLAWALATDAVPARRDPDRALRLAKEAVELKPEEGNYWNTLGAAHFRAGDWKAAIAAFEKSMDLRKGGDSSDWFFLAMAHQQLGQKHMAGAWYDRAVQWMDKNQPTNIQPRNFALWLIRGEAAGLLGLEVRPALKLTPGPTLVKPAARATLDNGAHDFSKAVVWEFDWSDVPGATQYHLYVTRGKTLSFDLKLPSSSYRYEWKGFVADQNRLGWRWKVRALVNGVWTDWSEERSFDVGPIAESKQAPPKK
jgi:serine/threonine protein kinase/Flp pilus assembly protein TadD